LAASGAIALFHPSRDDAVPPPESAASSLDFQVRGDLAPLLYVKSLDGGRAPTTYVAETRGDDRRDALTLGDPFSDGPFLRASARLSKVAAPAPIFFVDLVRQAAEAGQAVVHASPPERDAALEGPTQISDLTLEAGDRQRACLGFRFKAEGGVDLSGLACGAVSQPVERVSLECLISRLQPTPAGAILGRLAERG
jgi:hypothetical protein